MSLDYKPTTQEPVQSVSPSAAPLAAPASKRPYRPPKRVVRRPLAQGGASKPGPDAHPRLVTMVCRTSHTIAGQRYGPGRVTVREDVAAMLAENEQRVVQSEARFYDKRAYIVGRGARGLHAVRVPYESMQDPSWSFAPVGTAHGTMGDEHTPPTPASWESDWQEQPT